jgi:hypothetical protein
VNPTRIYPLALLASFAVAAGSCCSSNPTSNTTTCSITFQNTSASPSPSCQNESGNVTGYVLFSGGTAIVPKSLIVVQWSTDSFNTSVNTAFVQPNQQGFVAIPFAFTMSFCLPSAQIQLRAFQSEDRTAVWKAGEATGRYDLSDNGNGAYTTVAVTSTSVTPDGIIIYLDGTAAQ